MSTAKPGRALKICLAEPELALLSFPPPHGGRSSMVEPRIVVPDVAGSNPVGHPRKAIFGVDTMMFSGLLS
jgi:hypothetical protein